MRRPRTHHRLVFNALSAQLILAQAMVEHGLLDQISAGLSGARYQLELYVGQGNTIYVVIGVVLLLVLTRVKRRH